MMHERDNHEGGDSARRGFHMENLDDLTLEPEEIFEGEGVYRCEANLGPFLFGGILVYATVPPSQIYVRARGGLPSHVRFLLRQWAGKNPFDDGVENRPTWSIPEPNQLDRPVPDIRDTYAEYLREIQ